MAKKKKIILLVIIIFIIFLFAIPVLLLSWMRIFDLQINLDFRQAIKGCDKIIIRDGCNYPENDVFSNKTLKEFDDPCEIGDFVESIRFSVFQEKDECACPGWPAIDFYRNGERIFVAAIKHKHALYTELRPYDISFTAKSRKFFENLVAEIEKTHPEADD